MAAAKKRRARPTRRRIAGLAAGTVVLLGFGAGVAFAATTSESSYVTAIATLGSVDETLTVNGTIQSETRRDLAFGVGGTVDTIDVEVGDTVEAGDTLATLDDDELQDAVDAAESQVSLAQQTLDSDLESQTSTASTSETPSSGSGGSTPTPSGPTPAQTAALAAVSAAQDDLLALITIADAAAATSDAAVTTASTDCGAFASATAPTTTDPSDPAYDPAVEAAALAAWLAATQADLTTCQGSTSTTQSALADTSAAQGDVSASMAALDAAVAALQTAFGTGSTGTPSTGGSSTGSSSSTSSASAPSGGLGVTASAADIAADRAAIAAAEAQVDIAEQQLTGATLTSPIAGTVAQVTLSSGETVTAGSTEAVISVIGDDGYVIESTVSLAQVKKVEAGQTSPVTITSTGETFDGTVSAVGITDVSETSDPAYAITIAVDAAGETLLNGAAASAQVAVASAESVLTVPLSALHSDASGYSVDVLVDGEPTAVAVEVGAIGADTVEITSGLDEGDVVVLADADEEIATESESTNTGLSGLTTQNSGSGVPDGFPAPPEGFTPPTG